ncbi:MAG: response regulator [Bacteroidota bacterium]
MNALVGHLDVLRRSALTRLQQARLDCALEEAMETANLLTDERKLTPPEGVKSRNAGELRVLVVEDDETNRFVVMSMLKVIGVQADAVSSAAEALAHLSVTTYDFILMDVMMPGMDGAEATEQIRVIHGDVPRIIGLTALPQSRDRCLEAGMDGFMLKPIRISQLQYMLKSRAEA